MPKSFFWKLRNMLKFSMPVFWTSSLPTCILQRNLAVAGHAHLCTLGISTYLHLACIHVATRVLETFRTFSPTMFATGMHVDESKASVASNLRKAQLKLEM